MKVGLRFIRSSVAASTADQSLELLVQLRAPAPTAGGERPPLCIVPVVDVSGSMRGPKLAAVQQALQELARHLVPGDHVGLVAFGSEARTLLPVMG
jgi:Ca-activated chloride channel family protein